MQRTIINPLYKDTITFLKTTKETGGDHSLHLLTLQPGGANPPHIHTAFTETFTAVEGILGLRLRNKTVFLRPGESYVVQKRNCIIFSIQTVKRSCSGSSSCPAMKGWSMPCV